LHPVDILFPLDTRVVEPLALSVYTDEAMPATAYIEQIIQHSVTAVSVDIKS